jgi:magnesium transporter
MLASYAIREKRLVAAGPGGDLADAAWIDLLNPGREEEAEVERLLGIGIPTREEIAEIEVSSRLYKENDAFYMTASVLTGAQYGMPEVSPVTFILARGRLVTVRYAEPGVFRIFVNQTQKADSDFRDCDDIFIALLEAVIDRTADILEKASADTDAISRAVFRPETDDSSPTKDYKEILRRLGRGGDLTSRVRESLVSLGRLVNFLTAECGDLHPDLHERTRTMTADIRSLSDHASFVANTTTFLLDALLGLINIEQNAIIKIVSVISILIMPPTLVASIYGMNFRSMPELNWSFGYPIAVGAMVLAAVIPYWYFKRRGWL